MVKGAADIADDDPLDVAIDKLRQCCLAEAVADLLGPATGVRGLSTASAPAGDLLGRAEVGAADGADPAADSDLRGHSLGGGAGSS